MLIGQDDLVTLLRGGKAGVAAQGRDWGSLGEAVRSNFAEVASHGRGPAAGQVENYSRARSREGELNFS